MAANISPTTGEIFYRWTVIEKPSGGKWLCLCSCGTLRFVRSDGLKSGTSRSCGCLQREVAAVIGGKSAKNLVGNKFGRLMVVRRNGSKYRKAIWECECDCGVVVSVNSRSLLSGNTRSCGCLQREVAAARMYNPDISDEDRELAENRDLDHRNAEWRIGVYERDGYSCQACGDNQGGNLVAHHKDGYHWCRERRYDVENGVTVCTDCHNAFHNVYGRRDNTEQQWNDFVIGVIPKERVKTEIMKFDLSGERFHGLLVVRRDGLTTDNHIRYLCRCDCGNETHLSSRALKRGKKSCGCRKGELIRDAKFDDISGIRFGHLVVRCIDSNDKKRNRWVCDCDCGNVRIVFRAQLIQGKAVDCQSKKNYNTCLLRSA